MMKNLSVCSKQNCPLFIGDNDLLKKKIINISKLPYSKISGVRSGRLEGVGVLPLILGLDGMKDSRELRQPNGEK